MFEEIFKRKKLIPEKLIAYGFQRIDAVFRLTTDIENGEFSLTVLVGEEGSVDTELVEKESGEPYILYKTDASGPYVGGIRAAIEKVLTDIADACSQTVVFKTEQARMAIQFVRDFYGDEPEFLWTRFPDNAVWRRKDNKKWYGAILTVLGKKIGLDTDEVVEIIDLRMNPGEAKEVLAREHYHPGWHMNKKTWYTIVLDSGLSNEELRTRIVESHTLVGKTK